MSGQIDYTYPPLPYEAFLSGKTQFSKRGMTDILNSGEDALNSLFPDILPFKLNEEDMLDFSDLDVTAMVTENTDPIAFVVIFGVIGVLVTLAGIVWCIKRCACRDRGCQSCDGGADRKANDYYGYGAKKQNKCQPGPVMCGVFIAVITIASAYWLVGCFVINEMLRININRLPTELDHALSDLQLYLGTTNEQITHLFKTNFDTLVKNLETASDEPIPIEQPQLVEARRFLIGSADALSDALMTIQNALDGTRADLEDFKEALNDYSSLWYYGMLLICLAMLAIFLVLITGIFLALFGHPPDSDFDDHNEFFSRKTGSACINCGIFLVFCMFFIFTVVMVVHFVIAGVGGQIICQAIINLENLAASGGKFENHKLKPGADTDYSIPPYSSVIEDSKHNTSAYEAFQLQPVIQIETLKDLSGNYFTNPTPTPREFPWSDNLLRIIDVYGTFTHDAILNEVGQTGPLYTAYRSTVDAACIEIVTPAGGFWLATTMLLCLYIPLLITGCVVSGRGGGGKKRNGCKRFLICL